MLGIDGPPLHGNAGFRAVACDHDDRRFGKIEQLPAPTIESRGVVEKSMADGDVFVSVELPLHKLLSDEYAILTEFNEPLW